MKRVLVILFILCSVVSAQNKIQVPYTRHVLSNGLNVILNEDHSTPTVTVNTCYHVGSSFEKPGRTGFAHLFEHLMSMGSAHVPEGQFYKLIESAGGYKNASTNIDRTYYYEDIPSNALELVLYLESDRMQFLVDAMTPKSIDAQRAVVKNERRQRFENSPYGLAEETILKNLYPPTHPYSWPVIGSMTDLNAATYDDVVDFFRTYYVPNNASIVITGDIDPIEVLKLVEKWYGGIPSGKPVPPQNPAAVKLYEEKIIVMEDRVQLPRLYMTWISPKMYAPGDGELDLLASILTDGKNSRLYKRLVYDLQIAQDVRASQNSGKLSSQFELIATARSGHTLEELKNVIQQEIDKIKNEAPKERELQRVVNQVEVSFLDRLDSPASKADMLNSFFYYTNNPDYANENLSRYKALSVDDIQTAAQIYLQDNARVILSVVPNGKSDLAVQPKAEGK